jgi:hypothetical protein
MTTEILTIATHEACCQMCLFGFMMFKRTTRRRKIDEFCFVMINIILELVLFCWTNVTIERMSVWLKSAPNCCSSAKAWSLGTQNNRNQLTPWRTAILKKTCSPSSWQEIQNLLWNSKIRYGIQKNSPWIPILNQMTPVHMLISSSFMMHFNIILLSAPVSPTWYFLLHSSDYNFVGISHFSHLCTCPTNIILFGLFTLRISGDEAPSSLHSRSSCYFLRIRSKWSTQHPQSMLFH